MANISAQQVQKLREQTGLSMMEIKKALVESKGDEAKAVQILKERGLAAAGKRTDRATGEGTLGVYLHTNKKLVAVVSLRCETDFVAKSDEFQELAKKLAMHVAALSPAYVTSDEIPAEAIAEERASLEKQLADEGKSADLVEKILPGKLEKFYAEQCLVHQAYALDPDTSIADMLNGITLKLGENIRVGSISRITL